MRGYAAHMPNSVKYIAKMGKSHAFYDPAPTFLANFALPTFFLNPYPGDNNLSSTSRFVKCPFLSAGVYFTSLKILLVLLHPLVFCFLLCCCTAAYSVSVPACCLSGIRDIHLSYFHHLLLWSSVETQDAEEEEGCFNRRGILLLCLIF